MRALMMILATLMMFNTANAGFWNQYDSSELTDEALIAQIEAIADELDNNDHTQKVLNMAYNRSRLVRKKLNWAATKTPRLKGATDADILPLLQDAVTSLDTIDHKFFIRFLVKKQLNKVLNRLEKHREVPSEIAVLSVDGAETIDFGLIFFGTNRDVTLQITNNGNGPATVTGEIGMLAPFDFSGNSYPGINGSCGISIAAGETCAIEVRFAPTAPGTFDGQLDLVYNDGAEQQNLTKMLTGRAN